MSKPTKPLLPNNESELRSIGAPRPAQPLTVYAEDFSVLCRAGAFRRLRFARAVALSRAGFHLLH